MLMLAAVLGISTHTRATGEIAFILLDGQIVGVLGRFTTSRAMFEARRRRHVCNDERLSWICRPELCSSDEKAKNQTNKDA